MSFVGGVGPATLAGSASSGNGDIKLYTNKKEQALYESYADLYAIIKTTEKLERAFVRDAIDAGRYEEACGKLIGQFKVLWASMKDTVPNVESFMSDYNMQCPMAATRLLHSGIPATVEHRTKPSLTSDPEALGVAETVEHFITAMDSLKLNLAAVDQICPILLNLINSMDKIKSLPADFGPRAKVMSWYKKLYQKPANYELPEDDVRQLMYELEASYNTFLATLRKK
ncbi:hypothetical protein VOLCADRAFT_63009 [Volvox carteri f. nagariensis]|uniref:Vacuolar protein sorting-associated protein 28 homolog n=1 Tax=Volvox carteri f. nagariensis TaxID=3068 RepID=D8U294_VOLCA|nr:uncharacterized protein VOLCADRAFT_63009 [Volvox carteri f. nagariensis]EFJ46026.1 hypothetical protein VOLCADRAFT_63009 [Volvox carteri f. nagariensis]|eukprot:XP_002952776.1 hypothetical protein VOLCADRAFT_63009 [Volvox carteri f. nagariensis]